MTSGNEAYDILTASGVNAVKLNQVINEYRKGRIADSESAEDNFEALKKFTIDITQKRRKASLIRLSAGSMKFVAPFRSCHAVPKQSGSDR